jgi:hypothetical protein
MRWGSEGSRSTIHYRVATRAEGGGRTDSECPHRLESTHRVPHQSTQVGEGERTLCMCLYARVRVFVCVFACARAHARSLRVCASACVRVCVYVRACVGAGAMCVRVRLLTRVVRACVRTRHAKVDEGRVHGHARVRTRALCVSTVCPSAPVTSRHWAYEPRV